ncbi:MAG: hypothetical protein HWE39_21695 [Oceanospirillaceae bacterium]|uniref:hypothetical protein n=1 Tax=Salipiger sp. HF18 TaxID=2721557 RepID=UPI00142E2984|nr:hypothetical protein [Salipiger sp. HF18]NIY96357.1 hypothetical protein [Salipiger sp. HF18]NVK43864.1 hypothetical protein [Oceanospirillaceae bacterium]
MEHFEVRVGCFRQDPNTAPKRMLFRWEILRKDNADDLPIHTKPSLREDFVLPEEGDTVTLTLMSSDWSTPIPVPEFGIIKPRDDYAFRVYSQEGDLRVKVAKEGRYEVRFAGAESSTHTTIGINAGANEPVREIRDRLVKEINRAQAQRPLIVPRAKAILESDIALSIPNVRGKNGEITPNPTLPAYISASGPEAGAILAPPRNKQGIVFQELKPSDHLKSAAESNPMVVVERASARLQELILPGLASHLAQNTGNLASSVEDPEIQIAVAAAKEAIENFTRDYFHHVAKTFFGRNTDLHRSSEMVVQDGENFVSVQRSDSGAFVSGTSRLISEHADRVFLESATLPDVLRNETSAYMDYRLLEEAPAMARLIGDQQVRLGSLAVAIASGQETDAKRIDNGEVERKSIGWLMGMEAEFEVPDELIVENDGELRFENVNCLVTWESQRLNTTLESRRDLRGVTDCLNKALYEDGAPDPSAYFVEDGYFNQENTIDPGSKQPVQNTVFIPTTGDGVVSICVKGVGGHGAQFNAFSIIRTETDTAPGPADRERAEVEMPREMNSASPEVLENGTDPRQPFSILTDGLTTEVRAVDDIHHTDAIMVDTSGVVIDDSVDAMYKKQLDARDEDPDADLSTLVNDRRIPPYGKTYYYWLFARSLGGDWRGPFPVTRDSLPDEVKQRPRGLLLPPLHAQNPAAMPILSARVIPEPPMKPRTIKRFDDQQRVAAVAGDAADSLSINADPTSPTGYFANVVIDNKPVPASDRTTDGMPRYARYYLVNGFNLILFRRVPRVQIEPTDDRIDVLQDKFLQRLTALADDLGYYQGSRWYKSIIESDWDFAGISHIPLSESQQLAETITLRYGNIGHEGTDQPTIGLGAVDGGWEYLAVVVGKRAADHCYQIPRTRNETGFDPNSIPEFPVVSVKLDEIGRAVPEFGTQSPRPYVLRQGPLVLPKDHRAVRFEHSNPSITLPGYAPARTRHIAPRVEGIVVEE